MTRWLARIVVVLLALIGWYLAPIVAALQLAFGDTARHRAGAPCAGCSIPAGPVTSISTGGTDA